METGKAGKHCKLFLEKAKKDLAAFAMSSSKISELVDLDKVSF